VLQRLIHLFKSQDCYFLPVHKFLFAEYDFLLVNKVIPDQVSRGYITRFASLLAYQQSVSYTASSLVSLIESSTSDWVTERRCYHRCALCFKPASLVLSSLRSDCPWKFRSFTVNVAKCGVLLFSWLETRLPRPYECLKSYNG
jgi:hypothetical protein